MMEGRYHVTDCIIQF